MSSPLRRIARRFVQGRYTVGDAFTVEPITADTLETCGPVDAATARGLPGVGRGIRLIANVAAQLPVHAERYTDDTGTITERVTPTPRVLRDPDPVVNPGPGWYGAVVDSLVMWGNAVALRRDLDTLGYPRWLPLIDLEDAGGMSYNRDTGTYEVGDMSLSPSDVLHIRVNAPAGRRMGVGILEEYQNTLKLMRATEGAQFVLLQHGVPTGLLKVNPGTVIEPEEARKIKESWMRSQARRTVAVLSNIDFQRVSFNADEIAMIPTREFNLRLASDLTGVPPYMLGVPSESRVYANAETEWSNFIRTTLATYLRPIEHGMGTCLPSRGRFDQAARFDMSVLMRGDAQTRWTVYEAAARIGAMTREEIRNAEGLGPMPTDPEPAPTPTEEPQ